MLKKSSLFMLDLYRRLISPLFPLSCRFYPSCSDYSRQAILKYGLLKGSLKGIKRLLCCQPLSGKSGFDPLR